MKANKIYLESLRRNHKAEYFKSASGEVKILTRYNSDYTKDYLRQHRVLVDGVKT